ncbi:MAG: ArgE/DapE family deacylase [Acidobacteriota bacterium]
MSSETPTFHESLEILKQLIRIPSVNPSLVAEGTGEREIAEFLCDFLQRNDIEATLQHVIAERCNVVAVVRGLRPGARILLNGHLDTVSVAGMRNPFGAAEQNGRIFGRGSQDMKSGLAASVAALLELQRRRHDLAGEVVLAGVIDEEDKSLGTQHFLKHWPKDRPFSFGVVLEPTDLKVCTAHKGFAWLEVQTRGIAAHGSRPAEGVDAIRSMGRILEKLDRLDRRLQSQSGHALLGTGSLHASLIEGGREWSSYPDFCRLKYERRTLPGETDEVVSAELEQLLNELRAEDPHFVATAQLPLARSPFQISRDHPQVRAFYDAARRRLPQLVDWGSCSFWTDAALMAEAGIPTVVFGSRGAGLHSTEEYVVASDVSACAAVLFHFLMGQT